MLRTIISPVQRRSFVSSVLLTRTWENESLAEIRKELKTRGLPLKGNKATLILRIQGHDKTKTLNALREPPVVRQLSTPAPGSTPEIPPASEATASQGFLNVVLPDLWQPVPEIPVQIPYVPDFWDSSVSAATPVVEEPLPKLLVVAGATAHVSGGPSHNFHHDEHASVETLASTQTSVPKTKTDDGILGDITDDLGLPRPNEMKTAFLKIFG